MVLLSTLGARMGMIIFSPYTLPGTGPATKMFGFSLLYGDQARPFISFLIGFGRRSFGASFQPSGKTAMAPMFIFALDPSATGCMRFSYLAGTSSATLKIVSGSTSCGRRASIILEAKWQLAQAIFPVASRGSL